MAFLLLHVINQQLKPRNNLPFNCSPHQWINVFVIVVHSTHILAHPWVHHAHRMKSAAVDNAIRSSQLRFIVYRFK